jgi:HD superfamily phosphohydrolase YqeK
MSNERYEHTIAVVEYILKLVQRFKLNENECILAGIYHDTCKEFEQDKMISVCSNDERVKTYPF